LLLWNTSADWKKFEEAGNFAYPHVIDVSRAAVNSTLPVTLPAVARGDNVVCELPGAAI